MLLVCTLTESGRAKRGLLLAMDDETFVVQIATTESYVQYSISVQWLEQIMSEQSSEKDNLCSLCMFQLYMRYLALGPRLSGEAERAD